MFDIKLHTPEGVKDYLPEECRFKKEIENKIESAFNSYAYLPVKSPTFEFAQVFDGMGSLAQSQTYKFVDRDGSVLALRSDMTSAIARIVATAYDEAALPLRLYYIENCFRYNKDYQGKLREFTQAGVELIGVNSVEADAEVLSLAVNSLLNAGARGFRIDVGHVQFLDGLLEQANISDEIKSKIQKSIVDRNYVEVEAIVDCLDIEEKLKDFLSELPLLIGGMEVIEKAKAVAGNPKSLNALEHLVKLYEILSGCGLEEYICFDLGITGDLDYYTGIILRGYILKSGFTIISGGRYDKLSETYGASYPSVGFSIKINNLLYAFEMNQNEDKTILFGYKKESEISALSNADLLRKNGKCLKNSMLSSLDEVVELGRKSGVRYVLFFDNQATMVDLKDNSRKEASMDMLLNLEV